MKVKMWIVEHAPEGIIVHEPRMLDDHTQASFEMVTNSYGKASEGRCIQTVITNPEATYAAFEPNTEGDTMTNLTVSPVRIKAHAVPHVVPIAEP